MKNYDIYNSKSHILVESDHDEEIDCQNVKEKAKKTKVHDQVISKLKYKES